MSFAIHAAMKAAVKNDDCQAGLAAVTGVLAPTRHGLEKADSEWEYEKQRLMKGKNVEKIIGKGNKLSRGIGSDRDGNSIGGSSALDGLNDLATVRRRCLEDSSGAGEEQRESGSDDSSPRRTFDSDDAESSDGETPYHDSRNASGRCGRGDCVNERARNWVRCLGAFGLFGLGCALTVIIGGWRWRDLFPYHGSPAFDVVSDCRAVHSGPEIPCGSPWSSPCFERSRCLGPNGTPRLSVYVRDHTCADEPGAIIVDGVPSSEDLLGRKFAITKTVRDVAKERGILTESLEGACIVVYVVPTENECVSSTANWNEGQNHLLFDFHDQTRDKRPDVDGKAMFAQSNMRPCYFRYGHDIAVPLPLKTHFEELQTVAPTDRKYFVTFKGTLYMSGSGYAERDAVRQLGKHAKKSSDVVVIEKCQTRHHEDILHKNFKMCQVMEREYTAASFRDLMNTTFALVPSGRSPATYRLGEAMSAGAIPVFIHEHFVKPFPARIPWRTCSLSFPPEEALGIIDALRSIPNETLLEMQAAALEVYERYFKGGLEGIVHTTYDILEERLEFRQGRL